MGIMAEESSRVDLLCHYFCTMRKKAILIRIIEDSFLSVSVTMWLCVWKKKGTTVWGPQGTHYTRNTLRQI